MPDRCRHGLLAAQCSSCSPRQHIAAERSKRKRQPPPVPPPVQFRAGARVAFEERKQHDRWVKAHLDDASDDGRRTILRRDGPEENTAELTEGLLNRPLRRDGGASSDDRREDFRVAANDDDEGVAASTFLNMDRQPLRGVAHGDAWTARGADAFSGHKLSVERHPEVVRAVNSVRATESWRDRSRSTVQTRLGGLRPSGDCMLWTGPKDNKGYPRAKVDGQWRPVAPEAFVAYFGRYPRRGMKIIAACGNRLCLAEVHMREEPKIASLDPLARYARRIEALVIAAGYAPDEAAEFAEMKRQAAAAGI